MEALRSTRVSSEKRCVRNGTDQLNILRPEARLALEAEERIRLLPKGEGRQNCKRAAIQDAKDGGADVKRGEGGRISVKGLVVVLSELSGDCVGLGDHVLP